MNEFGPEIPEENNSKEGEPKEEKKPTPAELAEACAEILDKKPTLK